MTPIVVSIPGLRLVSEANRRDKWAGVRRAKEQRTVAKLAVRVALPTRETWALALDMGSGAAAARFVEAERRLAELGAMWVAA